MYRYDEFDQHFVDERVAQFRDQTRRYIDGTLSHADFLHLRLRNGLYIQRLAPMLRVAVPYGTLTSRQLRMLAHIARYYDKGYGHLSTRTNMQFNWPDLAEVPDILADLASVQMHAIQTSGNCIRNVTADQFAGVAEDEAVDGRPYCELIRQWSTAHPEFDWLPRKFKIAINGSPRDRAAIDDSRHRHRSAPRGRQCGLRHLRRRRIGSHADSRQPDSRGAARRPPAHISRVDPARVQPLRSARQQAQSPREDSRTRVVARSVSRSGRRRMGIRQGRSDDADTRRNRSCPRGVHTARLSTARTRRFARRQAPCRTGVQSLGRHQRGAPQTTRLRDRDAIDEGHGCCPRRRDRRSDGRGCRLGRSVRIRRNPHRHEQNFVLPDVPEKDLYTLWTLAREQRLASSNLAS